MLVSLSWLKEFIDIQLDPTAISDVLTEAGLEVEKVEKTSLGFQGIVVGKVIKAEQHPDAERLRVATVSDGVEQFQVVCGAPNCKEGLVTAFAKTGATLTDDEGKVFKIKRSKLRGVESQGMLCSEKELGISSIHEGIMDIEDSALIGKDMQDIFGDVIFEISLTPNLGHCMSIRGIARELAALINSRYHTPKIPSFESENIHVGDKLTVTVQDPSHCKKYTARYLENVTVKPSPDFISQRLEACGLRPVNNIVDITNYVMLELGQPLHAFDYDKLEGQQIQVGLSQKKETLITLDEVSREVPEGTLLIYDANKPVAIAGVMGALNSSITEHTTRIALEAAYFDPSTVRKSSKSLNLRSDASSRFEKNTDPEAVIYALNRASQLIVEHAGATCASEVIDESLSSFQERKIPCRLGKINGILGTQLSVDEVEIIFKRLRMGTKTKDETFEVSIPSFRNDIVSEIDLIEEVARIYGYNNIEIKPSKTHLSQIPHCNHYLIERKVRNRMIAEGLQETLNCDLISPKLASLALGNSESSEDPLIHVLHPSSVDQSILRPSLLPGFLQMIRHNLDHQTSSLSCFEIGLVHYKQENSYHERPTLGVVLTGQTSPDFWQDKSKEADFFDLKGILENLFESLNISSVGFTQTQNKQFHPGKQALIESGDCVLGSLGEVHPQVLGELSINQRVFFAEIDLQMLFRASLSHPLSMTPLPQFPGTERDWTVTVSEELPLDQVLEAVKEVPSRLLKRVHILDLYQSDKLGSGKKNLTLRFQYRDDKKTIAFETAEKEHSRILSSVKQKLSSEILSV